MNNEITSADALHHTVAAKLNGREYRAEITKVEEKFLADNGLVVMFGASDDLMEIRGAVHDEIGAYNGGSAYFTSNGLLENDCDNDSCPHFLRAKNKASLVKQLWCAEEDYSWTFKTTIPHSTFDIMEGDEKYCKGIVFALSSLVGVSK